MKVRLLIVDDGEMERQLLALFFGARGFEVVTASGPAEALDLVHRQKPDFVLLDLIMPEMDGLGVLQILRERYSPLQLPIIIVTAQEGTADIVETLKWGANDYVSKPVNFDVLLHRVKTQLAMCRLSQDASRLEKFEAITALVATYNHEINNPLTIGLLAVSKLRKVTPESNLIDSLENALLRIAAIVKKTASLRSAGVVEFEDYRSGIKILKLG